MHYLFAVTVSFVPRQYEVEESAENNTPLMITVLAQGDLSDSRFNIPVAVIGGTATGMWDHVAFNISWVCCRILYHYY